MTESIHFNSQNQNRISHLAIVIVIFLLPLSYGHASELSVSLCTVSKVIDGDTLIVQFPDKKTEKVRLIGVDTPETEHPSKQVEHYGKEASAFTKRIADGKKVRLELDQAFKAKKHRGVYGRLLAYIFIQQADGSWLDLNAELIKQGYAHAYTRFPFSRLEEFRKLEKEAREAKRGLWAEEVKPVQVKQTDKCLIKGNIGSKGKKIYHMPGMRCYKKTKIDESKGERWFCTEEEAVQAGWRKSSQ